MPADDDASLRAKVKSASRVGKALKTSLTRQSKAERRIAIVSEAIRELLKEQNQPDAAGNSPFTEPQINILHEALLDCVKGLNKSMRVPGGFGRNLTTEWKSQTAWEKIRNVASVFALIVGWFTIMGGASAAALYFLKKGPWEEKPPAQTETIADEPAKNLLLDNSSHGRGGAEQTQAR